MGVSSLTRTPALIKMEKLLRELEARPMTSPEIMAFLCLSENTTGTYIRLMRQRKQIHIGSWSRAEVAGLKARLRPVYSAGPGRDAKRPPAITKTEAHKRWYARMKKDPGRYSAFLNRAKQRAANKKFKPHADIAAQWVFRQAA